MKSKLTKFFIVFLIAIFSLSLLAACKDTADTEATTEPEETTTTEPEATFPLQLTDQLGRTVTIETVPQRIISLAPSNTEIIYAFGLEDRLVGVTDYCNYPAEAAEKQSIGGFNTTNIEQVVALAPDLILATSIHQSEIIPQLENYNLTVVALAPKTFDEVLDAIEIAGRVTGEEEKATKLLTGMRARINAVTEKLENLPEDQILRVFYLTWHDPLMTSGGDTLINELIEMAGGVNIFAEISGAESVDLEVLVAREPQVLIAGTGMGSGEEKGLEFLNTETRLADTEAAVNGRIYGIHQDLTGRACPRIVDGLEAFARCIHPEIFGEPEGN